MPRKPTYHELEQKVSHLERETRELKQANETLWTSDDHSRILIHNIDAAIAVFGPESKIIDCNRAALEMAGMTRDQVLGKDSHNFARFYFEDGRSVRFDEFPVVQVLDKKKSLKNFVIGIKFHDRNDILWTLCNAVPILDHQGQILQVVVTYMDITERKQMEDLLVREKEKLQEALAQLKKLTGMFPICSSCKKIRDDNGYWNQIENYIRDHSEAQFSHGICPDCMDKLYGEEDWYHHENNDTQ